MIESCRSKSPCLYLSVSWAGWILASSVVATIVSAANHITTLSIFGEFADGAPSPPAALSCAWLWAEKGFLAAAVTAVPAARRVNTQSTAVQRIHSTSYHFAS